MKRKEVSILNPDEDDIKNLVKQHKKYWGYANKIIYMRCIKDAKNIKLCEIQETDINGPIKTFLINWGMMTRVLNSPDVKGWEQNLSNIFPDICDKLIDFRRKELENTDIPKFEDDIKNCYKTLKGVVKGVSASKLLHLICPHFFPLWDTNIRKKVNNEWKKQSKDRIDDSETGYYNFMKAIKTFLTNPRYNKILSEFSKHYKKSKLRIIDMFMWVITHPKD